MADKKQFFYLVRVELLSINGKKPENQLGADVAFLEEDFHRFENDKANREGFFNALYLRTFGKPCNDPNDVQWQVTVLGKHIKTPDGEFTKIEQVSDNG